MPTQLSTNEKALRLFFTEDIYLLKEVVAAEAGVLPASFTYLGKNGRNILLLVNDPENEVSTEKGRELLRKIVKSLNLSANDFALLNYAFYPTATFDVLEPYFGCKSLLCFGVSPQQIGLNDGMPNSLRKEKGVNVIFSEVLPLLDEDPIAKKTLWAALKKLEL